MADKFESKLEKIPSNVWSKVIMVPDSVSKKYLDGDKRVICTLNDIHSFHAALLSAGQGSYFININKEIQKKLKLELGSKVNAYIIKDESKYGIPLPEEMEELLKIDDEASEYFHKLTKGKQRSLLYLIGKPKSSNKRLEKAIVITEYLKNTRGKLDFKDLNEAFKENKGI